MKNIFFIQSVFAQEFDDVIGRIDVPKGVDLINEEAGAGNIGILLFVSKFIRFITLIASIWVIINLIIAAYKYLTGGGKAETHQKVREMITNSVIGLIIIVSTYTIAGLIGIVFFGDPTYIINPTIIEINSL